MPSLYYASCLCGAVTFSVTGFAPQVGHCHCTMCRKFHGSAFSTMVQASDLTWLTGKDYLSEYTADNGATRTFCRQCGSSLGYRAKGVPPQNMEVALACFDEAIPVTPDAHIYTDFKANWFPITDTLPQYGEGRDGN